jgi:hypothetical protein
MGCLDRQIYLGVITGIPPVTIWREVRNRARHLIRVSHTTATDFCTAEGFCKVISIPSGSRVILARGLTPETLAERGAYGEIIESRSGFRVHLWPLRTQAPRPPREVADVIMPVTQPADFELPPEFCSESLLQ